MWRSTRSSCERQTQSRTSTNLPIPFLASWTAGSSGRVEALYESVKAPVHRMSLEEAEIIKLCNNVSHALKIGLPMKLAVSAIRSALTVTG